MAAKVMRVRAVQDHPEKPMVSVVKVDGAQFVAQKVTGPDGERPRYAVGGLVVFVEPASIVPEYLLRGHYWNDEKDIGGLHGPAGNRVKAGNFARVRSEGIHYEVEPVDDGTGLIRGPEGSEPLAVREGDHVSADLGITQWQG